MGAGVTGVVPGVEEKWVTGGVLGGGVTGVVPGVEEKCVTGGVVGMIICGIYGFAGSVGVGVTGVVPGDDEKRVAGAGVGAVGVVVICRILAWNNSNSALMVVAVCVPENAVVPPPVDVGGSDPLPTVLDIWFTVMSSVWRVV